jgi:uncharacterized protein (TIGR02594 family)
MPDVPKWLEVMRSISGTQEYSGAANNPKIMDWVKTIAKAYPEMQSYCDGYTGDDIAWCGLTVAYCMTMAGIRPVFGPTDTDRWMWAQAWAGDEKNFKPVGHPTPGTIVVMTRSGGGHVTLYEETDSNGNYRCRGGNQSDAVNVSSYDPETVIDLVWPTAAGDQPQIPVEDRPMLEEGDSGPDVIDLQRMIPNFTDTVDGDFGPATKENVVRYQYTRGLEVDGIVGQETWRALYANKPPLPPPAPPPGALTLEQQAAVRRIASESTIASYSWRDRGQAPRGYTQGMALSFAQDYLRLIVKHPAVMKFTRARTNSDKDALNLYAQDYRRIGAASNEQGGLNVLINLYALMLGSGMRETSGEHCCGRDQSASNVSSDTAEAGLFQTSYNAAGASNPEFDDVMDEFTREHGYCYLETFADGVSCSESDWECYGSGRGFQFQQLCKNCPMFAVETHALTLRSLCNHYGPIVRHEVELKSEALDLFEAGEAYMQGQETVA